MKIQFSEEEILHCERVAEDRLMMAKTKAMRDYTIPEDQLRCQLIGCLSEAAVMKAFGLKVSSLKVNFENRKSGDVVINKRAIEVRGTELPSGRLIIRPRDRDDRAYILVHIKSQRWAELKGWIVGRDGKKPEWEHEKDHKVSSVFFVPTNKLKPFVDLMTIVNGF